MTCLLFFLRFFFFIFCIAFSWRENEISKNEKLHWGNLFIVKRDTQLEIKVAQADEAENPPHRRKQYLRCRRSQLYFDVKTGDKTCIFRLKRILIQYPSIFASITNLHPSISSKEDTSWGSNRPQKLFGVCSTPKRQNLEVCGTHSLGK